MSPLSPYLNVDPRYLVQVCNRYSTISDEGVFFSLRYFAVVFRTQMNSSYPPVLIKQEDVLNWLSLPSEDPV